MQTKGIIAGIDEAGYGPLLGPYVLGASFFEYNGPLSGSAPDFWQLLSDSVSRKKKKNRIAVGDSKDLFKQKKGLNLLEEGVLGFLAAVGKRPSSFRELLKIMDEDPGNLNNYPWYRGCDIPLPKATFLPLVDMLSDQLKLSLNNSCCGFLGLRAKVLRVGEFNKLVERFDNKSTIGLFCIGEFLQKLWEKRKTGNTSVFIDRQGGRIKYARFLWKTLCPKKVIGICESPDVSAYRVEGKEKAGLTVSFVKKGDKSVLPIALASMLAKYIRELHMDLFNSYFADKLGKTLRPTAGYVQDGRRFLADIESYLESSDLVPELLIRQR